MNFVFRNDKKVYDDYYIVIKVVYIYNVGKFKMDKKWCIGSLEFVLNVGCGILI